MWQYNVLVDPINLNLIGGHPSKDAGLLSRSPRSHPGRHHQGRYHPHYWLGVTLHIAQVARIVKEDYH